MRLEFGDTEKRKESLMEYKLRLENFEQSIKFSPPFMALLMLSQVVLPPVFGYMPFEMYFWLLAQSNFPFFLFMCYFYTRNTEVSGGSSASKKSSSRDASHTTNSTTKVTNHMGANSAAYKPTGSTGN